MKNLFILFIFFNCFLFSETLAQQITVTSPNGGENWQNRTTHLITWTDNISENVKIELFKGGVFHSTIISSTPSDGSKNWDIPLSLEPGSDYKIKISSVSNSAVFDFSNNNFTIVATEIVVTSPNGGENWQTGTSQAITWTDNIVEQVKIELYKDGLFHSTIVESTFSDGSYTWDIPLAHQTGIDYKIKIKSVDEESIFDFSDNDFIIVPTQIVVTSPNGGENWQAGTSQPITWTDNISENVKIELFKSGTFHSTIVASTFSDGSYTWDIPLGTAPAADYKVKVSSVSNSSIFDFSDNNFTVFPTGITIFTPNGGENWQNGTSHTITWTDNISDNVKIELFKSGSFHSTIVASTFSDGSYTWDIPLGTPAGIDYKVKITSVTNGSIFDLSDNDFSIYATGITITSPNGGESLQTGTTHQITWTDNLSEQVVIELFKGGTFHSTIVASTFSDGNYSWDIPLATPEGSDYKIKITSVVNSTIFDFSDNDFNIVLSEIDITAPNGGESWQNGTSHTISWTDNIGEKVKIELFKGGSFNSIIEDSTFSDGSYTWDIPLGTIPGTDYKVKITSVVNNTIFDFSDNDFNIVPSEIDITAPNGGELWQTGSSQSITWIDNVSEKVSIELYRSGSFLFTIVDSTFSDGSYTWEIPLGTEAGTDYKIKISSITNPTIFDFSDNNFTIVATGITVTSPNGGENWQTGTSNSINWTDNISEKVKIELYKGGTLNSVVEDSTFSDGSYSWEIPLGTPAGTDYQIKITSIENSTISDFSDNDFSILATGITVTSPNGGENWQAGSSHAISWTDNISEKVKIELYKGGTINSVIADSTFSDGSYTWDIPLGTTAGSDYKIKITSNENSSIFDFSDNDFSIFETGITVTSPNGGENWQAGSTQSITWTDNISEKVRIELHKGGVLNSMIVDSTFSDGSYTWDIPLGTTSGSDYKIKIISIENNTIFDFSDNNFSIFPTGITVTSPNGGENWQAGTTHTITWTDNIAEKVIIELFKAGTFNSVIVDSTFSDGSYTWDIPLGTIEATDYKIKITSIENNTIFDFSDNDFSIIPSEINITSPNGGENWQNGTQHNITWTDNIDEKVKIELFKGGNFHSLIVDSTFSDGSYNWSIPLSIPPAVDYKVKITGIVNNSIFDFSDNDFSIYSTGITITSPNGGENWQNGTTHTISWTDNISEKVKIELFQAGSFHSLIADSTFSDGSYTWDIPTSIPPAPDYKIKITSIVNNTIFDFSDNNFTIYSTGITITVPNGGENWQSGTTHQITWTDNIGEKVNIELYKGGNFYYSIVDSTFSDGSYNWDIPLNTETGIDYKVKIVSVVNSNIFDYSDNNFIITMPEIAITSPNGGESWQTGTTHTISWTDNISENVRIELFSDGTFHSLLFNSTPSDGSKNWQIPLETEAGSDYKIKITSVDNDQIFDFSDDNFSIFATEIIVTYPNGGEILERGTTYAITWDDNITEMVSIELYKGGNYHSTIVDSTISDGSKNWNVPLDAEVGFDYRIKITSVENNTIFDFSDSTFSIVIVNNVELLSGGLPDEFTLRQNFPNPFNPSTNIKFGLPEHSNVSLKVYDITGQEVLVVLNGEYLPAGNYNYKLIANSLPSGIYIYFIIASSNVSGKSFRESKKMVLLK